MKDLVLKGFVKSFSESRGLSDSDFSDAFEAFTTHTVLRKYHSCNVSALHEVLTGGSGDGGIDGLAILLNGKPIRSEQDLDFFRTRMRQIEIEFVFVQAKTSASFDSGAIGTFLFGVSQFFSSDPDITFSPEMEALRQVKDAVYDLSISMDQNPTCSAYYVTTGEWHNNPEPSSRIRSGADDLRRTNLFSSVNVLPVDAESLKTLYRELERGVTRIVELTKTAIFPSIDGVSEAYLGLLSGNEFRKLIANEDGSLNRDLFYDNVRDFQGNNPVNSEIASTLSSPNRGRFPLLNNGITIVARNIARTGDQFRISDFQIVNGCQTTHVLHQNGHTFDGEIYIPIKLIVTDDSEIITEVIKATNWQTAVMPEALESLTPFHKEIEDFYNGHQQDVDVPNRIYYERRSKQYHFDPIPESNVVTLTAQTKSFVAMFLNEPHSHPRYYGELLKAYETRLFVADHKPALYFASGLAYVRVHSLFNKGLLDKSMRTYLYHVLMLLRIRLMPEGLPKFNSQKATEYALTLIRKLNDDALFTQTCQSALQWVRENVETFSEPTDNNPPSRLRAFTRRLLDSDLDAWPDKDATEPPLSVGDVETGTLRWFDQFKGFGFIDRDKGGDIFVHISGLKDVPWKYCVEGTRLKFEIVNGPKTLVAKVNKILES